MNFRRKFKSNLFLQPPLESMTRTKRRNNDNMSRQPPLPPGLPPRPRNGYGNGDSYRPQSDNYYRQEPEQVYQFRGAAQNSYRPSYDQPSYDQRPRHENYPPGISPPRGPATGSYRDRPTEFSFRHDAPPALDFQASSRLRSPPRQRTNLQDSNGGYRGRADNANNNRGATRGGYRGRAGPRMASDREFLRGNRAPTPELMPGMDDDQGNAIKYVPMEDVSDSDEAEMNLSDSEGAEPKKKQARTDAIKVADGDSVPKWSNPDPYTVLPPLDESQRKKKDVVKLIRKARVTSSYENINKTEAVTDDFISFGFDGDGQDDNSMLAQRPGNGVEGAPTGPRLRHRDNTHKQEQQSGSLNQFRENQPAQGTKQIDNDSKLQPPAAKTKPLNEKPPQHQLPNKPPQNQLPTKPAAHIDLTLNPDLGNRKRTIRDEIKGPLKAPPMIHSSGGKKPAATGEIVKEWRVQHDVSPTPWLSIDHSDSANMGVW
jgi:non-canonical poly(A) RNA polymerase PAPD5/7